MQHFHVSQVMEIEKESFQPPWDNISFHILIDRGCQCWILENDRCIVGYSVCQLENNVAHILNLCVRSNSQGQGYGRKLLEHALENLGSNVQYVLLEVRKSNQKALNLYLSSGFLYHSIKPNYYPQGSGQEDAIVLIKDLYRD